MHTLTLTELQRIVEGAPGNEALADLLLQMLKFQTTVRVDLDKLLRKPD